MQDLRFIAGVMVLSGGLSALVKYVLPLWVRQPEPWVVWSALFVPVCGLGLALLTRRQKV
ncbi:MAG: hypothetical protein H7Y22_18920 [Gemmatimonadaceae bacterium]|nr:hypothetical protein [Gloeobacterales cyanobacterium ES-bin-141]